MQIFFGILACVLLFGMIGTKNKAEQRNYTLGFITCNAGEIIITLIK